jgi:hypothetical protein
VRRNGVVVSVFDLDLGLNLGLGFRSKFWLRLRFRLRFRLGLQLGLRLYFWLRFRLWLRLEFRLRLRLGFRWLEFWWGFWFRLRFDPGCGQRGRSLRYRFAQARVSDAIFDFSGTKIAPLKVKSFGTLGHAYFLESSVSVRMTEASYVVFVMFAIQYAGSSNGRNGFEENDPHEDTKNKKRQPFHLLKCRGGLAF